MLSARVVADVLRPGLRGLGEALIARAAAVLVTVALLLGVAADASGDRLAPVQWRMAWSASTDDEAGGSNSDWEVPLHGASEQVLAMAIGDSGVRVHDARTGRLVRVQYLSSAPIAGVWVTSGTVVVLTGKWDDAEHRLQAFDAATGATLWRRAVQFLDLERVPGAGRYSGPRVVVTERGIVIAERRYEPLTLLSLDPRSGAAVARTTHERHCDLTAAGARSLLVLLDHCAGNRVRLSALDPSTLRADWRRTMSSPGRTFPDSHQLGDPFSLGLTVSGDGYAMAGDAVYAPDGRRLPAPREAPRAAGSVGNPREAPPAAGSVRGSRWSEPLFLSGEPGVPVGPAQSAPAFLTSLDQDTGRRHSLPLDVPSVPATLVGTAPGTAFVLLSTGRVAAYTLTYGVPTGRELFDGVPLDAWPDACGLLSAADLRPIADGYTPSPATPARFGQRLPRPARCDWIPPTDDAPVVSLAVEWVSSSSATTRRIYAAETTAIKHGLAYDASTEDPYLLDYLRPTATGSSGAPEAVVGAGQVIVRLVSTSRSALRLLAPLVRDALLARYGLARPTPAALPQLRWSFPVDGHLEGAPTVSGDAVYAAGGGRVYAMDASSGRPRWSRAVSTYVSGPPQVAGDLVYAGETGIALHALDIRTGRPRWRYSSRDLGFHFLATRGRVILCAGNEIIALHAATGRRRWRFRTAGSCAGSRPQQAGGTVYIADYAGIVHALDLATGRRRWSVRTGTDERAGPWVTLAGKVVYVAGADRRVRALDAATGAQRWSIRLGAVLISAPLPAGAAVYVRSTDHEVHALDARTGRKRWTALTGVVESALVLAAGQDRLYAVTAAGIISVFDTATGAEGWSMPLGGAVIVGPVVHRGVVYVSTAGGVVHALDGATGARRWRMNTGDAQEQDSIAGNALTFANGLLYTGGGGNVYALRP
ncbi:PQQ-binding-like beta-propeller repeat protein [Nonomuraea fuscirosea]|uniref:outer membrane protein assembly factor BamB family protein n=1 Tax=Nonomuraea fuscirosea TaxID=1291556 RepID=UPI003414A949